jgi:predicted nucleic acid-binding protein
MTLELFVDASAWYPLAVTTHPDHALLRDALRERVGTGAQIVTSNLVVAEAHALLVRRVGIQAGLAFLRQIRQPPIIVVEHTIELEARAIASWLGRFGDQRFSLADAVSFATMAERGIREALTLDRHFATAGFVMVPAVGQGHV